MSSEPPKDTDSESIDLFGGTTYLIISLAPGFNRVAWPDGLSGGVSP
jgi:hypothetical protein